MSENADSVAAVADDQPLAADPAQAAEAQNADNPAAGADDKNPEQQAEAEKREAEKVESRRQRAARRAAEELAAAKAKASVYQELYEKSTAKSEAKAPIAPKREDFATEDEYIDARIDYRDEVKKSKAAEQTREAQPKQQQHPEVDPKLAEQWNKSQKALADVHKDYHEVVGDFVDHEVTKSWSKSAGDFLMESEQGPRMLYHLGTHEAEAAAIRDLPAQKQVAELARLEAKLAQTPLPKKASGAPPPANLGNGGKSSGKDVANMSQQEYEAKRIAEGARWAR